jgi:hypothetical protein
MNDKEPQKQSFWQLYANFPSGRAVAMVLAVSLGIAIILIAIAFTVSMFQHSGAGSMSKELSSLLSGILGAMVGALSVFLGKDDNETRE